MKYGLLAIDDERVTRVVATLESHHSMGALGEEIHDRAFTLIAPLGADDNNVSAQRSAPYDKQQTQTCNHEPEAKASQPAVFQLSQ